MNHRLHEVSCENNPVGLRLHAYSLLKMLVPNPRHLRDIVICYLNEIINVLGLSNAHLEVVTGERTCYDEQLRV